MAEISESEREKIRKEAKDLIDKFAKALEKVKINKKISKESVGGFREEQNGKTGDLNFRKIMFENAPDKGEDNIIAEKKSW